MAQRRRTRVLIVDDSAVMRTLLRSIITSDPALEVAGSAADGQSALASLAPLHPDLVLLDVEMPIMDGLVTLKMLRLRGHAMPVIMCSSLTQRGARVTIEALAGGASDYVAKPTGQASRDAAFQSLAQDLIPKIKALTASSSQLAGPALPTNFASSPRLPLLAPPTAPRAAPTAQKLPPVPFAPTVLVIGVSTGGPAALDIVLPALPADFPLPILVVQHMPELFTRLLAERLNQRCRLQVREAVDGDLVRPGHVLFARGNWHLEVLLPARPGMPPSLHLTQGPLENHCRPAVDVLFRSAATAYGPGVLAAVLTGMGSDGLAGARIIRAQGGFVLAQDQPTSAVWGMPAAVIQAGLAQRILPIGAVASEILRIVRRNPAETREVREWAV